MPDPEQRLFQDDRRNGPLVVARVALDNLYSRMKDDSFRRFESGHDINEVLITPRTDPLEDAAIDLVGKSPKLETHSWNDWFHLRATLDTKKQRVFSSLLFSNRIFDIDRTALHAEAYQSYGALMIEALNMLEDPNNSVNHGEQNHLIGIISELFALSLLTRSHPRTSGGMLSTAVGDWLYKTNMRYKFFNDGASVASAIGIQVAASVEKQGLPQHIVQVVTRPIMQKDNDRFYAARLIGKDLDGSLSPVQNQELQLLADSLRMYVIDKTAEVAPRRSRRPARS